MTRPGRISLPVFLFLSVIVLSATACVSAPSKPCRDGGEAAREVAFRGTKQCYQRKNKDGKYVNHGLYREWHPNGRLALEGQYDYGVKVGKWIEWDDQGRKISEKTFGPEDSR